MIKKEDILVLDTETTGFGPSAEILQLSIVNGLGEIVMNEYFRPARATCWPSAEAVNHISPAMVADKPLISERKLGIEKILHAAKIYGEPSIRYPGKYKYQKLITCAKYYGYSEEGWHDSLADTKATLYCFWKMVEDGSICIE